MSNEIKKLTKGILVLTSVLTLVFTFLKLTGVINWSWFMTLFPTITIVCVMLSIVAGICLVEVIERLWERFD